MPLFDFECNDCKHGQEHYVLRDVDKVCPHCGSKNYIKQMPVIKINVEYGDAVESYQKNIAPHVKATYQKIGAETISGDTKTLDNVFGESKVAMTYEDS